MIRTTTKLLLLYSLAISNCVFAEGLDIPEVPYWHIFAQAGERYGIDPLLLAAVGKVESNYDQEAININKDGSEDVGIMQINNRYWEESLGELGIHWEEVASSPETNINVGAWVLAQKFIESGVVWRSVGSYNAGLSDRMETHRKRYAVKVYKALRELKEEIKGN